MSAQFPVQVIPSGYATIDLFLNRTGDSAPYSIGFGVELAADDIAGLGLAVDEAIEAWDDEFTVLLNDQYRLTNAVGRGSPADGLLVVDTPANIVGTSTDDPPPSNCAVILRKRTALGGRQNRGRVFVPGIVDEAAVGGGGGIDTGVVTTLQTAANNFLIEFNNGPGIINMVIFHSDYIRDPAVAYDPMEKFQAMIVNPTANNPTPVTDMTVDPIIGTQRRRMR